MTKKVFMSALSAVVLLAAGYTGYKTMPVSEENDLLLDNVEALAQGEEAIYYDKVVLSCDCWKMGSDGIKVFMGMSILKCEQYQWFPGMVEYHCAKTSCQGGSSC